MNLFNPKCLKVRFDHSFHFSCSHYSCELDLLYSATFLEFISCSTFRHIFIIVLQEHYFNSGWLRLGGYTLLLLNLFSFYYTLSIGVKCLLVSTTTRWKAFREGSCSLNSRQNTFDAWRCWSLQKRWEATCTKQCLIAYFLPQSIFGWGDDSRDNSHQTWLLHTSINEFHLCDRYKLNQPERSL